MAFERIEIPRGEIERQEVSKDISTNRGEDTSRVKKPVKRALAKVGRNDPCPCGSGLKYKNCHGRTGGFTTKAI